MRERGLLRQALESHKTVSKKTLAKTASRNASANNSPSTSRNVSRATSENGDSSDDDYSVNSVDDMLALSIKELGGDTPEEAESGGWAQDLADRVEEIIDRKRSSTAGREATLTSYGHQLMSRYVFDQIESKASALLPALLKSIKGDSSEKEACLALRAISLTIITVPSAAGSGLDGALKIIKKALDSESTAVKAAAIQTLADLAVYGGASSEDLMEEFLEIVESDGSSIEAADSAEVVTAALMSWGFLASFIDDLEDVSETAMEAFVDQLESSEVSVQIAAGENIALLYEKSYTDREENDGPATDAERKDEHGYVLDYSLVKRYDPYRQKNQLEYKLSEIANVSSKGISKRDRKNLHTAFTDIITTVQYPSRGPRYNKTVEGDSDQMAGSAKSGRHKIAGDSYMNIDRWWKLCRLQGLKRVLGGGFSVHYNNNDVVFETLPVHAEQLQRSWKGGLE